MEEQVEVIKSPLCQQISVEGNTLFIEIYGDGTGRWILEIEDQFDNSTVWGGTFETDVEALETAKIAIEEEGCDEFVGPADGEENGDWQ